MKNKTKWDVVKHKSGGYCVSRDGKPLEAVFNTKSDAIKHKNNLKKVSDVIRKKYEDALKK